MHAMMSNTTAYILGDKCTESKPKILGGDCIK